MGDIKNLFIGLTIGSFILVLTVIAISKSSAEYGFSYDETQLETYNKLQEINNISSDIRDLSNSTQTSSVVDILGDFFKTGFRSVELTKKSIDVADEVAEQGIKDASVGQGGEYFKIAIITLIIITIIFAIVGILVGRDL